MLSNINQNPRKMLIVMHLKYLEGYASETTVAVKDPAQKAMFTLMTSLFVMTTGMIQMQVLFVKSSDSTKEVMQLKNPILVEWILRDKVVGTKYDAVVMSLP